MTTFVFGSRAARISALMIGSALSAASVANAQSVPARSTGSTMQARVPAQRSGGAGNAVASSNTQSGRNVAITLPAMNLDRALQRIADKEGVTINYDPSTARTLTSAAVDATSAAQAIQQAIASNDLSMKTNDNGSFSVGETDDARPDDIIVRAHRSEAETGYGVQSVSSATRDGKNLREQPQSTSIVTAKVLEDQQVQTITEALRNVSSTTVTGAVQGTPTYTVRGFTATATSGGLTNPLGNSEPVANVERIEVLKGPAAILQGAANLGGVVNIVSKHPTTESLLNVSAEYATFDERKFIVDGSTALDPDHKFSARLVGQYDRASRSAGGYYGRFENLIAPSIRYKVAGTDFTLGGEFSDRRDPAPQFSAFLLDHTLFDFPRGYGPDNQGFRTETRRAWYEFNQDFTSWLTFVSRGNHTEAEQTLQIFAPLGFFSATTAFFGGIDGQNREKTDAIDNYLRAKVDTGPFKHTIVAGANLSRDRVDGYSFSAFSGLGRPQANFRTSDSALTDFINPELNYLSRGITVQQGFYAQDTIDFAGFHLVAGVRRSSFRIIGINYNGPQKGNNTDLTYRKTTPNFGLVYDLTSNISVYANYLYGYYPNIRTDGGTPLAPQTSKNLEGGAKADLFGGKLAAVLSVYRLRQYNLPVVTGYDPVLNQSIYTVVDGQQTRGIDLDIRGTILPGWQILATGSLSETKYLTPPSAIAVIGGKPPRQASLFTSYELQGGALKGLGLGAGVYYNSASYAGLTNLNRLPEATQVDLNGYYTIGKFRLNVGVSNLLDDKLYTTSTNATYIIRKPGRMIRGTLTYSFFK